MLLVQVMAKVTRRFVVDAGARSPPLPKRLQASHPVQDPEAEAGPPILEKARRARGHGKPRCHEGRAGAAAAAVVLG